MEARSSCKLSTVAEAFFVNLLVGSVVAIGSSPFEVGTFLDNAVMEGKVAKNLRDRCEALAQSRSPAPLTSGLRL
jgi:hypothetical protein